jgi:hypothetical protein
MKFTGVNQTLTFNGGETGADFCVTGIDYSLDIDTYKAACAGGAHKATVTGQPDTTATIALLIEEETLDALFGASGIFERGANADDWEHLPEGSDDTVGDTIITSDSATVGNTSVSLPVEGLVAATVTIHFDDITIAAIPEPED